jgi:hypothetical protein
VYCAVSGSVELVMRAIPDPVTRGGCVIRHRKLGAVVACVCLVGSGAASAAPDCDFFVLPGGTSSDPSFLPSVRAFTTPDASGAIPAIDPVTGAGRTLCLLDGIYTGVDRMISIRGLHGTPQAPIVVAALNDGGAVLDGRTVDVPVEIVSSSHVRVEGLDARNSRGSVIQLAGQREGAESNTHHITLRRLVASNANPVFDKDGDGIHSAADNCTDVWNPGQEDSGGSPRGDACDATIVGGSYWDLVRDLCLGNPSYADPVQGIDCAALQSPPPRRSCGATDTDADGVPDAIDNCPFLANGPLRATGLCDTQVDRDLDGIGDACDADVNGDGIVGLDDASLLLTAVAEGIAPPEFDLDCDGDVDASDARVVLGAAGAPVGGVQSGAECSGSCLVSDFDQDGIPDSSDVCIEHADGPLKATGRCDRQQDADGDGFGDACDTDVDNDGIVDANDVFIVAEAASRNLSDPRYDFDCDGAVSLWDVQRVADDSRLGGGPGPSGLACSEDGASAPPRTDLTGDGVVDTADLAFFHAHLASVAFGSSLSLTGANNHVVAISDSDDVLVEDLVAFGTGRKVVQVYRSQDVTLRRVFARWEGNGSDDGTETISAGYRSYGTRVENAVATSTGSQRIYPGGRSARNIGVDWFRAEDEWAPADPFYTGIRISGSLSYQLKDGSGGGGIGSGYWLSQAKGFTLENSVTWVQDRREHTARPVAWLLGTCDPGQFDPARSDGPGCDPVRRPIDNTACNLASWGASRGKIKPPFEERCASIEGPSTRQDDPGVSVFVADEAGVGGQLCERADQPGVPLWPWPMQARLLRATAAARFYPVPASLAAERAGWQAEPVDLRRDVELMFGPIPSSCVDTDGDGIADATDNCSALSNPGQRNDPDRGVVDAFGNLCDCDFDGDGVCGSVDNALLIDDLCLRAPDHRSTAADCPAWLARATVRPSGAATDMNGDGRTDRRDWLRFDAALAANGGAPGPGPRP